MMTTLHDPDIMEQQYHDQILLALRYLAQHDPDGASEINNVGFNKPDSFTGRDLARQQHLAMRQLLGAHNMLLKYRRQLEVGGIVLPDWPTGVTVEELTSELQGARGEHLVNGFLVGPAPGWEEVDRLIRGSQSVGRPVDLDEMASIDQETPTAIMPDMRQVLGPNGPIAQHLDGYEPREEQIQMAELVADCIETEQHCIVEAGTGTGKSLAYLIPAIYSGRKAVVSTGVKTLQDQLARSDVPFLQKYMDRPFTAAVLKGRANYICLNRWNENIGDEEMFGPSYEYSQVKAWLQETETGDVEELPIALSPEFAAKVTTGSDGCLGQHCPSYQDCFTERAKAQAEQADIIIVNHTLLTLDCAIRQQSNGYAKVIPDRDVVIVDEAHRLEDAATLAFQVEVSMGGIYRLLHDRMVKESSLDVERLAKVEAAAQEFFDLLASLSNSLSYSIGQPTRTLQLAAENVALQLHDLSRELERHNPYAEGAKREAFLKLVERVGDYGDVVQTVLFPSPGQIVYVEKRQGKNRQLVYLRRCPISVAEDLRAALFDQWPTICTSATLATAGGFDYFRGRCGLEGGKTLVVDSPFDYSRNALIYMPANGTLFDPTRYYQEGSPEYYDRLASEIESLLLASDGRAFCLFTSNKALNEVYGRIAHRLRWLVLRQGEAPRPELLKRFMEDGHAVLFGLRSFWEGIDCKGEALSLVVIDKIPFGQPEDPIYKARCDEIVKRTGDDWAWFNQLALPNAIITYKQGFGRLIRTRTDFGVVALLDGRISTKRYGGTILSSLPLGARTRSLDAVRTFFQTRAIVDPQQGRLL